MFTVDYKQEFVDHGRILILVKNFEPMCPSALFEQLFGSLCDQLSFIHPKQLVSRSDSGRGGRGTGSDSFADLSSDAYSDLSDSSRRQSEQQSVWLRYVRDYSTVNLSWASFQAHRAILGLVGFCLCTETKNVVDSVQAYLQQKALISETRLSGRLFILVPTTGSCDLTIEDVNQIISDELQKMPQNLLLTVGEILAHPAEQLFTTNALVVKQSTLDDRSVTNGPDSKPQVDSVKSHNTSPPLLTPRVVGTLVDLAAQIRDALQNTVESINPKPFTGLHKSYAPSGVDLSDGESSESGMSSFSGGPTVMSDVGSGKATVDGLNSLDERRFIVKPYLNYTSNAAGNRGLTNPNAAEDAGAAKQRRISGRWKKHMADVALQIGDFDLAQLYYEAALQLLKPLGDHLWVAGSTEGLCAVAVLRRVVQNQNIDPIQSGRNAVPVSSKSYGSVQNLSRSSENPIGSETASQKIKRVVHAHPSEFCQQALDALELYKKAVIDKGMLEEMTFKVARLLVTEKQSVKAVDLLDTLVGVTLSEEFDGMIGKVKRLSTLVELFRDLGYLRRAGLIAWLAFDQHIRLPGEQEFGTVFRSLRINHFTARSLNDPDAFAVDNEDVGIPSDSRPKQPVLRKSVIPTSLIPEKRQELSVWVPGSYKFAGKNGSKTAPGGGKRNQRIFQSNKRLPWTNQLTFHPTGWSALQVSVVCHIVDHLKTEAKIEDSATVAWEKGLQLIGFILSLLDGWPDVLGTPQCCTFMEDLCRLAVLRSPDQPRLTSSMFTSMSDASGNVDRRLWPRQHGMVLSNGDDVECAAVSTQPRQLVDLIEIPVHKLPVLRKITVMPLPDYLIPCELSQAALASAVPSSAHTSPVDCSEPKSTTTESGVGSVSSTRVFFYAPTGPDLVGGSHTSAVDWVCEEPVELEFLVDNVLPVDLRLSELRVELIRIVSPANRNSSNQPHTIQLEAVRLIVELPTSTDNPRKKSKPCIEDGYPVELNKTCLLEAAQDYRFHPRTKLDTSWRRRAKTVSCELPAKTSGIRLLVNIVPTMEMLRILVPMEGSSDCAYYRITGLTYRLIDFGAMHVCIRVPMAYLESEQKNTLSVDSDINPMRVRRSSTSSSANSTAYNLRSSLNSGLGSLLSSGERTVVEHPTVSMIRPLFSNLPPIRLRSPMPRLHIFPGLVRSAHTFTEACEFLPSVATPSMGKRIHLSSKDNIHIQPPWFHPPQSDHWSDNVASTVEVTLYPFESRWMPLQILVRDEAHINLPSSDQPGSTNELARQMNVFRAAVRATEDTNVLLKKLQLSTPDVVQCVGVESIQKKLPITVLNNEMKQIASRIHTSSDSSDGAEPFPFCATDCGLIWLSFHSESFWRKLSVATFIDSVERDRNFRTSKKLFFELRFEYAVDVPCKDPQPSSATSCSGPNSPSFLSIPARRVSFGINLTFLSSKHSPLYLYSPLLVFHDEPFEDDSDDDPDESDGPPLAPGELRSDAFFYGTLQARLPVSLVPRPIRFVNRQYRVRLNVTSWWRNRPTSPAKTSSIVLQTPWNTLTELSPQKTSRIQPQMTSYNDALASSSSLGNEFFRCVENPDDQVDPNHPQASHRICLRLRKLSDVVLSPKLLTLSNSENLRSDEIGLPIPVDPSIAVHAIESNLGIMWQSYLDGRLLSSDSTDKRTRPQSNVLPDIRFYRFGCMLLATNEIEPWEPELSRASLDSISAPMNTPLKPWYGRALSTASAVASLLWCHALRLRVALLPPADGRRLGVCGSCSIAPRRRTSIFSRRGSQPIEEYALDRKSSRAGHMTRIPETEDDIHQYAETRRMSMPERQNPKLLRGLKSDLLSFSSHVCAHPLEPVSIVISGSVSHHPLANLRLDEGCTNRSPAQNTPMTCPVRIHRVWTGPVIYEIVQQKSAESAPTSQLSEPLIEGKDFCFIGTASGKMGLSLASNSSVNHPEDSNICAVCFFRPGRFWLCGLIGLLHPDFQLPSTESQTPGSFTMPNISNVQTIRFSPMGVSIHVFDTGSRKDAGLPPAPSLSATREAS
ncbi:hypothetical protein T265_05883 [Opisthorchis viverrini]|uniref:Trs120/TRAPPC9 N-terminal domain-containing protein n=2 Tax=Opisthorchis viverrini TaxID=6198 RepID=A0A074ZI37_OPIVI|nr:hypothetical protein T265_05883 [Opisthorchis viverrini]KER26973.1 hypothetical protein T265_05883 [Opisthorchis viverrini]